MLLIRVLDKTVLYLGVRVLEERPDEYQDVRLVRADSLHQIPQGLVMRVAGRGERARRDEDVDPRRDGGRARRWRVRFGEYLLHVQRIAHRIDGLDRHDLAGEHRIALDVAEVQLDRVGRRNAPSPRAALQRHRGRVLVRADATERAEVRLIHAPHVLDVTQIVRRATAGGLRPSFEQPAAQTLTGEREKVALLR